jgi:nicotinamide-nucleotide amidase
MKVKIIAVGTEVLTGLTLNTNAAYIGSRLSEEGYIMNKSVVVADDREELLDELTSSKEDIVILTGGLGPTIDDFTKEVVAKYLGVNLLHSEEVLDKIKARFAKYNVKMDQSNLQQALVFENGVTLNNNNGTAPGFVIKGDKIIVLLPGPPKEMKPMFEEVVSKHLSLSQKVYHLGYKLVGIGESSCEGLLRNFYHHYPNVEIAPYALDGEIKYLLRSNNHSDLIECDTAFKAIFSEYIIGDYKTNIFKEVFELLVSKEKTISFAESCTGGLATSKLVDIPGSSKVLNESIVTYANEAKTKYLNVREKTLDEFGAVSVECVREMLEGLSKETGADVNVAISGIAGPDGGTKEKPVGLVYVGVLFEGEFSVDEYHLVGSRTTIRERACHMVFRKVYKMLK